VKILKETVIAHTWRELRILTSSFRQDSWYPGQDANRIPPEYSAVTRDCSAYNNVSVK
jgi:hypothetical protein